MKHINIFWQFFLLGLFSFGGPVAHISYFRKRFVEKLKWLDDESFSKIVALSQFLPGPASSQVGFSIGLQKGGIFGAILAFIAFTFPSFLILYFAAIFQEIYSQNSLIESFILGLKLFAVVIVADATIGMFQNLCKTAISKIIFVLSVLVFVVIENFIMQLVVIITAGFISYIFSNEEKKQESKIVYKKLYLFPLVVFIGLFIFSFMFNENRLLELFNSFYQVGSLVFGGGHVVLPLISSNVNIDENSFLTAYSLAQALPGPLFTIASYIGTVFYEDSPFLGAVVATIAIFLPGFLLILAFYESFETYCKNQVISKILVGINASVVAILFSVLCLTVIPNGILNFYDFVLAIIGLILLKKYKIPVVVLIIIFCFYAIGFK